RDLLVDLALREAPQRVHLPDRERTGLGRHVPGAGQAGELVDQGAHDGGGNPQRRGGVDERGGGYGVAAHVVGDQVRQPDRGRVAGRVGGVVALDRGGGGRAQPPAPREDSTDEGVVDPELAALQPQALLRQLAVARGEVRVDLGQDGVADVVEEGRHRELIARVEPCQLGDPLGGGAGGDGMAAELVLPYGPQGRAREGVVGGDGRGGRARALGAQALDGAGHARDRSWAVARLVARPHDRDREAHVGL